MGTLLDRRAAGRTREQATDSVSWRSYGHGEAVGIGETSDARAWCNAWSGRRPHPRAPLS